MGEKIKELENVLNTTFYPGDIDEISFLLKKWVAEFTKKIELEIIKHPLGNQVIADAVYNVEF